MQIRNAEMENSHLKESFVKSNVELHLVESINGQLSCQIRDEREMLHLKENELLEAGGRCGGAKGLSCKRNIAKIKNNNSLIRAKYFF